MSYALHQRSLLGLGVLACAQKFGDFPVVNNGKSKNKLACAKQNCIFADENWPNGYIALRFIPQYCMEDCIVHFNLNYYALYFLYDEETDIACKHYKE